MNRNIYVVPTLFFTFFLAVRGASPVQAETAPASAPLSEELLTPEAKFISDLGEKTMVVLGDTSLSAEQFDVSVNNLFDGAFDVEKVGQFAIGGVWLDLSVAQRQEYLKLFKDFVLRNYGARLRIYHGEKFQVRKAVPQGEHVSVISTEIVRYGGPSTNIDWVVSSSKGKFAIIDVVVDGISQGVTQRDQFASILSRNGNDFNALLDVLRERITQTAATIGSAGSELPVSP
ncbi:MAG: ABC transporter substrate-binding protein [Alphaproteobacteria bacterium]|nr:ABC transporter substrate-binding protein [Alphaproteobacteria bacterium]